jgi:anti-anti-sigma factor
VIITTRDVNEIKVVEFDGEFDTTASPAAESQLNQLREQGVRKILVDFQKMEFISSAGLRVLLATAQELQKAGGELRVCNLNEDVMEVFDISGFSTILMVFKDESEALQGF